MTVVIYIVSFILVVLIVWKPSIGIGVILGLVSLQGLVGDWLDNSEFFFQIFGIATAVGYLLNFVYKQNHLFHVSPTSIWILLFTFYLLVSNFDLAVNSPERNWFSTYLQLFMLVVLMENVITSFKEIEKLMLWFSIGSVFYFVNLVSILNETGPEGLVEGANMYTRAFLVAALLTYYLYKNSIRHKLFFIGLLLIQAGGIVLTQSRTGIILLFISLLYVLYKDYSLSLRSVFIILISGVLIYYVMPDEIITSIMSDFSGKQNLQNPNKVDYSSIDSNIRFYLWGIGYDLWTNSNLFLGIGIGQFKATIVSYLPGLEIGIGLHNTYLSILFETGIFGFIIFMGFIIRPFVLYLKASGKESEIGMATIWFMCYIVILIGGVTKHEHYDKILFSVIGMSYFFSRGFVDHAKN